MGFSVHLTGTLRRKKTTHEESIAKDPAGRRATGIQIKEGAQA